MTLFQIILNTILISNNFLYLDIFSELGKKFVDGNQDGQEAVMRESGIHDILDFWKFGDLEAFGSYSLPVFFTHSPVFIIQDETHNGTHAILAYLEKCAQHVLINYKV